MNDDINMKQRIFILKLDREQIFKEESQLMGLLPLSRKEKALKLKNDGAKSQSIAAGLLLMVGTMLYIDSEEPGFKLQELTHAAIMHLANKYADVYESKISNNDKESFYTNLSHSGDYVVLAVGDSPVGIDVEHKNDKDFKVTKRMFTETEQDYIIKDGDTELSQKRFRDIWTINEAFLKCLRIGISVPLNTFEPKFDVDMDERVQNCVAELVCTGSIHLKDNPPEKLVAATAQTTRKKRMEEYHFSTYRIDGGDYSLTFVS